MHHTSARGAINILCHLGVKRIIALGLDGKPDDLFIKTKGKEGKIWHHAKHPRGINPDIWKLQREEFAGVAHALKALGVEMLNASPGSAIPFWPIVKLEDVIHAG